MTKRRIPARRVRRMPIPEKEIPISSTTDEPIQPNQTLPPEGELPVVGPLSAREGTTDQTPEDKFSDETTKVTAQATLPGLAALVLSGRIGPRWQHVILALIGGWLFVGGWLYVTDNSLGRLDTAEGIHWFFTKFFYISCIFAIAIIIVAIYKAINWGVEQIRSKRGSDKSNGELPKSDFNATYS